ncbi:hypothetical protein D3C71_1863880 [compost metagenome]
MAHDAHIGVHVVAQAIGEAVKHRSEVALDVGAAGVERDVAGNVELELVVLRLRHGNARALRRGFHLALLLFHVLRPDVGAQGAHTRAHQRARAGLAARGRAEHRAGQRTHARTRGRAALGVGHAGVGTT